jgi:outer membrane protein TolC
VEVDMKVVIALLLLFSFKINTSNTEEFLTLESAINEALESNPEIKAAKASWEAKSKRPSQLSTLPNPTVGVRFKNVGFSEITLGEDPRTDIQTFLIQEIPFPTKLSSKKKIAFEISEAERWAVESTSRKIIADLKQQYYEWFFISKSIEITKKNKGLLKTFVRTSEVKYEVGKGIQQDVLKAQVELSSFIQRLELLNMKKQIIEAKIKKILNRPQGSDIGMPQEVEKSELNISFDQFYEIAKNKSPDLLKTSELVDSKEEALGLARKQYYPDFVLQATYFNRDGGSQELDDLWEVGLGLKIPLYFWRKEKLGVQEAELNLKEANEGYEDTESRIEFELKDKYVTAKTAEKLIDLYKKGIIPQSQISLESAISGYQVGNVDFLTLLNSLVTLFNFEIEYYRQLSLFETSVARLEELAGVDLM